MMMAMDKGTYKPLRPVGACQLKEAYVALGRGHRWKITDGSVTENVIISGSCTGSTARPATQLKVPKCTRQQ